MIAVSDVARAILFNLGEMYARKHSDPELLEAINAVLRVVNIILINRESNWVVKEAKLKVKNGKSNLPDDFVKMKFLYKTDDDGGEVSYDGDYKIVKDTIYVGNNATKLDYFFTLPTVDTMEDEIDLPSIFLQLFIRYATGLIDGTFWTNNLDQLLSQEIDDIAGSSNYPVIERPMEFYC